ncbi:hypothetical protein HYR99_36505 [Candidatus Poribacteria bacterium]|nr:hypothetical protein [Candidatus Poribacteria bacterium]
MLKLIFRATLLVAILAVLFTNGLSAQNSTQYLPMTKGHFWEYEIKVPEGGNYFSLRHIVFQPGNMVYATRGQNPFAKTGTYVLRYVVKGKTEDPNVWEIQVEKDTLKLYADVEKVFWEFEKSEKGFVMVTERLLFTRQFAMMHSPSSFMRALKAECSNLMFFEQPEDRQYTIESKDTTLSYLDRGGKINMPTRIFSNCITVGEVVKPSDEAKESFPPSLGWFMTSVWAPQVGLVHKTQVSVEKRLLWSMDLIDYGVK